MNGRGKSTTRKAEVTPILTYGEKFDDGAVIELVQGSLTKPNLLLWDGAAAMIGPRVKYRGRTYESPEIPASVYRAVLLPAGREDFNSLRQLYDDITAVFARANLRDNDARLAPVKRSAVSPWLLTNTANRNRQQSQKLTKAPREIATQGEPCSLCPQTGEVAILVMPSFAKRPPRFKHHKPRRSIVPGATRG